MCKVQLHHEPITVYMKIDLKKASLSPFCYANVVYTTDATPCHSTLCFLLPIMPYTVINDDTYMTANYHTHMHSTSVTKRLSKHTILAFG